ncbi:two-component response regulator-like APRR7 isoform X2 [Morus notabilis]|uniref:two-component response regulator-like APRR7 isoform X2 n=1 Tax=Morus notabilis TaxID=981085 RepID=UPI000CED675C|nr:two-component response regulator-like APRR7 isoform X2 [Morus notabilis]
MSFDDDESKELPELNHKLQDGKKGVNNENVGQEQRLLEDDELGNSSLAADVKDWHGGAAEARAVLQVPQQQQPSQGAMVCWERFLHLRSLKVLLVENDDSTRHVVTALLRNCSYEVIEATNGLQAWKILEDLTNHVDLILTEVVMPCLSGIALLWKIMSHKTRKNVPVIMMSSHDSMGLVFKCLSKGAVDFLVKPIRKNELKNLWQHVWRRCHSSSGSGSESGALTQKSVKSKTVENSGNNTGSNDEEENGSVGLNIGEGSDNGSGTQSSWTKQAVEVDSPRQMSSCEQTAECPDSNFARVVHPNAETGSDKLVSATARNERPEQKEKIDDGTLGKDLEIGMPSKLKVQLEYPNDIPTKRTVTRQNNLVEMGSSKFNEQINKGQVDIDYEKPSNKLKCEIHTLTGVFTNTTDLQMDNTEYQAPNGHCKVSDNKNKGINDSDEMPSLELSLKRLRGVKGPGTTIQDDRNVLRRSESSAFSRYNAASNSYKAPTRHAGSSFPHDNSMDTTKDFHDIQSQTSGNPPNHGSVAASNNVDTGCTTNNAITRHIVFNKSVASSTIQQLYPSSAFHPVKNDLNCAPQQVITDNGNHETASIMSAPSQGAHKVHHTQHLHIHYDNYQFHHHPTHGIQQQQPTDHNDFSLKKLATAPPHCGSSNVLSGPVDCNNGNCSINRSASGSNHGSSTPINVGGTNIESENGVSGNSGSGDAIGSGRADDNKAAHREAALTKFRLKRKERCFRNRVRYQSRKRLAEQRPRVRGQFVRQTTASESTSRTSDS